MPDILKSLDVRVRGNGSRLVLLGNGFGTTQDDWTPLANLLGDDFRVVSFDAAGAAPATEAAWHPGRHGSYAGYVEDLLGIISALDLRNITYIGHSVSGMIGVMGALLAPERFSQFMLVGSSARYLDDPSSGYVGGFSSRDVDGLLAAMRADYAAWANGFSALMMGDADTSVLTRQFATSLHALRPDIAIATLGTILRSDHRAEALRFRSLRLPAVVIQADDDPAVPLSAAQWLAGAVGGKLRVQRARGHFPHIASPDELHRHVLEMMGSDGSGNG